MEQSITENGKPALSEITKARLLPRLHALCFDLGCGREAFEWRWQLSALLSDPYVPENHRHRMIFIHVPKTGGTTVLSALFGIERPLGHKPAVAYQAANPGKFAAYFKFAVVRNPWNRLVSTFWYLKQGGMGGIDEAWANKHLAHLDDFPSFARALADRRFAHKVLGWKHFLPQSFFIHDAAGKLLVDHVARQERLDLELGMLAGRWGIDYSPQRANASRRLPHQGYYDDETRAIVGRLYAEDVARLGYSFEKAAG